MEDSAPLPVVDHRVEGGGGNGQQGGDEAVLAQQPQTPRFSSSSGSSPSSSSSGQAESKPAPKKRNTWKRQYVGTWTHAHEEGLKSTLDAIQATSAACGPRPWMEDIFATRSILLSGSTSVAKFKVAYGRPIRDVRYGATSMLGA